MSRQFFTARGGQNTVELALCIGVLMVLTIGVVDLARGVWAFNTISYLAREGARFGIVPSRDRAAIQTFVATRAALTDDADGLFDVTNVTIADRGTCGISDDPVVVTVAAQFRPITAALWGGAAVPLTLQATSRMYVELGLASDCGCDATCAT